MKCLKDLNVRYDIIKQEHNTGKTFFAINCSNIFLSQSYKTEDTKAKKKKKKKPNKKKKKKYKKKKNFFISFLKNKRKKNKKKKKKGT